MSLFSWKCPFCNTAATIGRDNFSRSLHHFNHGNKDGNLALVTRVTVCPNPECKEFVISASLHEAFERSHSQWVAVNEALDEWELRPESAAKPFPDYIPLQIRQDYEEACLIVNLSPKASATLARRALQGMIHDFWKINKGNLGAEIKALEEKVDSEVWTVLSAVRSIGNIGAHMEKDINLIIDVDPSEATMLIELLEQLMEEWYIHRHQRQERMRKVVAIADEKRAEKQAGKPGDPEESAAA